MLDDQDEDVRIAVRALGDMRNGSGNGGSATPTPTPTPALSIASSSSLPTTSLPSPAPSFSSYQYGDKNDYADDDEEEYRRDYVSRDNDDAYRPNDEADLVERMSHLPLVGGALRAYEQGKASSRVVKYGAEMMESVARPVVGRLQLDEFACRQLDRLDRYRRSSRSRSPDRMEVDTAQQPQTHQQSDPHRRSPSPPMTATTTTTSQEVAQRSRWHTVLLEAGGLSAALSEESLRRLRYVLSWLLAATEHLDAQIVLLRDFTQQVDIAKVRRDIVQTVRGAVDVVGKYAGGGALGEGGRRRVRGFVLELPRRWAAAMGEPPVAERESVTAAGGRARRRGHHPHNSERGVSAGMDSPLASPRIHAQRGLAGEEAAQKVLTLATESLDMMRGVMSVVKDSLDRADAWVERLGLQRDGADLSEDSADTDTEQRSILPPSLSSTRR